MNPLRSAVLQPGESFEYFGTDMVFTETCHRPQPGAYSVEEFQGGVNTQIDVIAIESIPDIGDGSPCFGNPPS